MGGRREGGGVSPGQGERWFCYVLECADGTLYTGIARSIEKRLAMHDRGRAARYTRGRLPVRLLYAEPLPDRSAASRREIQVKRMSREAKRRLAGGGIRAGARRA